MGINNEYSDFNKTEYKRSGTACLIRKKTDCDINTRLCDFK